MEANDVVVGVITELMLLESELLTLLSSTVGLLVSVEMSIELVVIYFLEQVGTYHPPSRWAPTVSLYSRGLLKYKDTVKSGPYSKSLWLRGYRSYR